MSRIVERLPYAISTKLGDTSSSALSQNGRYVDYAIAGIPFLANPTSERPFVIETAQMQRDQFDNEQEPGEQTLQGWWLRSQDSWHMGAGQNFQEGRGETVPSSRFKDSSGVDPWTENEVKLLRRMVQSGASNVSADALYVVGSTVYLAVGPTIRSVPLDSTTVTLHHTSAGESFKDLVVGQKTAYAITQSGKVVVKPLPAGTARTYPLTYVGAAVTAQPQLAWAKHRLWAIYGRSIYTVNIADADLTAQASDYSHPSEDWVYSSIAEGPSAVYVAGWSDAESAIQLITINDDGTAPTLTAAKTTAILPPGERVQRIATLAGSVVGIGTDKGFRVGFADQAGEITYGPLFLKPDDVIGCTAVTAWDRFFFVAFDLAGGGKAVYRVDASRQVSDGEFAWAKDVEFPSGTVIDLDVAPTGDRVIAAVAVSGAAQPFYSQHATELVPIGFIEFGRIRYRTTEPKIFKYVALGIEPLEGTISLDAVVEADSLARLQVYSSQGTANLEQAVIPANLGPQRSMGFRFTLDRDTDATKGPVLHSYSVKSLPAVKPQRLISLELMCYDNEKAPTGHLNGYKGFSRDRLAALHLIEDSGDLVLWQDFSTDQPTGRSVKIERAEFSQSAPPNPEKGNRGYGGALRVTLRSMD